MLKSESILRHPEESVRLRELRRVDFPGLAQADFHALAADPSWWVRSQLAQDWLCSKAPNKASSPADNFALSNELVALLNTPQVPHELLRALSSSPDYSAEAAVVNARGVALRIIQIIFDARKTPTDLEISPRFAQPLAEELNRRGFMAQLELSSLAEIDLRVAIERDLENPAGVITAEDHKAGNSRVSASTRAMVQFGACVTLLYYQEKSPHYLSRLGPLRELARRMQTEFRAQPARNTLNGLSRWQELVAIQNNRQSEALGILTTAKAYLGFCAAHLATSGDLKGSGFEVYQALVPE